MLPPPLLHKNDCWASGNSPTFNRGTSEAPVSEHCILLRKPGKIQRRDLESAKLLTHLSIVDWKKGKQSDRGQEAVLAGRPEPLSKCILNDFFTVPG
jgi:hypothetical protein